MFSNINTFIKYNVRPIIISPQDKTKTTVEDIKQYQNVTIKSVDPNHPKQFQKLIDGLYSEPDYAIFDTYIAEEYYSHFVY